MIRKNLLSTLRASPWLAALLVLCSAAILCVIITAYGDLSSLSQFYADARGSEYRIEIGENVRAEDVYSAYERCASSDKLAGTMMVSYRDRNSNAAVIGITDITRPINFEYYFGDSESFASIGQMRKTAFISAAFSNPYENLDCPLKTLYINSQAFDVAGLADYYFTGEEYSMLYCVDASACPNVNNADNNLYPINEYNGQPTDNPGVVIISARDFVDLGLQPSFLLVDFPTAPDYTTYCEMVSAFSGISSNITDFMDRAQNANMAGTLAAVCIIAILLSLWLTRNLNLFFLNARQGLWRGLYIIGCSRMRIFAYMLAQLALTYAAALILAFLPCRFIINWLFDLGISVYISPLKQALLGAGGILLMLIVNLPTLHTLIRKYTAEDGSYVQAY